MADSSFTPSSDTLIASVYDTSYLETDTLAGGTTYYYRVTAVDSDGTEWIPSTSAVSVSPLAAPTITSATWNSGLAVVCIAWNDETAYYNIYRDGTYIDSTSDPTYYDWSELSPGTYTYGITAVGANGLESAASSASVTVPMP